MLPICRTLFPLILPIPSQPQRKATRDYFILCAFCCEYAVFRLRPIGEARKEAIYEEIYEAIYEARSETRGEPTDDLCHISIASIYTRLALRLR